MARNEELSRVLGWIDELNTSLNAARSDQTALSNLLSSAEYELGQVRRQLSGVEGSKQGHDASRPAATVSAGQSGSGAQFAQKLRHPDGLRHGWWTVIVDER